MRKLITLFIIGILISLISIFVTTFYSFAAEKITLTTYYPSPYGIYRELRVDQMAIGSSYRNTTLTDGTLIVSDRLGINTADPSFQLDLNGQLRVNSLTNPGRDYRIESTTRQNIYASNDLVEYVNGNKMVIVGVAGGANQEFYVSKENEKEENKLFTVERDGNIKAPYNNWTDCVWTKWVQAGPDDGKYEQLCPSGKYQAGMTYRKRKDNSGGNKDWYSYRLYCCGL